MDQEEDFSKKTLLVLVALTLVVSALGTAIVTYEVANTKVAQRTATTTGQVSLTILPQQEQTTTTGRVTLELRGS